MYIYAKGQLLQRWDLVYERTLILAWYLDPRFANNSDIISERYDINCFFEVFLKKVPDRLKSAVRAEFILFRRKKGI